MTEAERAGAFAELWSLGLHHCTIRFFLTAFLEELQVSTKANSSRVFADCLPWACKGSSSKMKFLHNGGLQGRDWFSLATVYTIMCVWESHFCVAVCAAQDSFVRSFMTWTKSTRPCSNLGYQLLLREFVHLFSLASFKGNVQIAEHCLACLPLEAFTPCLHVHMIDCGVCTGRFQSIITPLRECQCSAHRCKFEVIWLSVHDGWKMVSMLSNYVCSQSLKQTQLKIEARGLLVRRFWGHSTKKEIL